MINAIFRYFAVIFCIVLLSKADNSLDRKPYSGRRPPVFRPVDTSGTKGSLSEQYGVTFKTNNEGSCQPWWPKLSESYNEARDAIISALQAIDRPGVPRPPRANTQGRAAWDRTSRLVAALWDIHVSDDGWKKDGSRSIAVFEQIKCAYLPFLPFTNSSRVTLIPAAVYNDYLAETKFHGRQPKYELFCGTDWLEWGVREGVQGWWSIFKTPNNEPMLRPPHFPRPVSRGPLSNQPFDICNGGEAATLKRQNTVILCPKLLQKASSFDAIQRRMDGQPWSGRNGVDQEPSVGDLESTLAREWIFEWGHLIQRCKLTCPSFLDCLNSSCFSANCYPLPGSTPPHIDSKGKNHGGSAIGYSSCVNLARYAPQLALDSSPDTYSLFAVMVHASYADWSKGYGSDPQIFTIPSRDTSAGPGKRPVGPPRRDTFSEPSRDKRPVGPPRKDSFSKKDRDHGSLAPGLVEKAASVLKDEAIKYCKSRFGR